MTHKFHSSILRAYDIRGIYNQTLFDNDAYFVGRCFAKILQKNNIAVECGILKVEAQKINQDFFKFITQKKPFITVKIATTLDGKIACKNFQSKWISGEKSRKFAHLLRAQNQAILIGANTIIQDDPSLDCRLASFENNSPIQIVVSKNLRFTFNEKFFNNNLSVKKILVCPKNHKENKNLTIWQEKSANNQVIFIDKSSDMDDFKNILHTIYQQNIKSILVEGGSSIVTQLIAQNLVDKLVWVRSKKIIGNDGIPAIGALNIADINHSIDKFVRTDFLPVTMI